VAEWAQAASALETGARLAPGNKDMVERLAEARERSLDERERAVAQVAGTRRDLAHRLKDARRADARRAVLTQWKQTMSVGLALPGCQISYMDHAGCHKLY
jgi:hypothetical protein